MRLFFDTEFIEDGRTIDLISIGLVSQDGSLVYYAEANSFNPKHANAFVRDHVLPKLQGGGYIKSLNSIRDDLFYITSTGAGKPEFWAYYADYDWVAMCQLFGTMMQLPKGWPKYCHDLKQLCDDLGNPTLDKINEEEAHNALKDATWTRDTWIKLQERRRTKNEHKIDLIAQLLSEEAMLVNGNLNTSYLASAIFGLVNGHRNDYY